METANSELAYQKPVATLDRAITTDKASKEKAFHTPVHQFHLPLLSQCMEKRFLGLHKEYIKRSTKPFRILRLNAGDSIATGIRFETPHIPQICQKLLMTRFGFIETNILGSEKKFWNAYYEKWRQKLHRQRCKSLLKTVSI